MSFFFSQDLWRENQALWVMCLLLEEDNIAWMGRYQVIKCNDWLQMSCILNFLGVCSFYKTRCGQCQCSFSFGLLGQRWCKGMNMNEPMFYEMVSLAGELFFGDTVLLWPFYKWKVGYHNPNISNPLTSINYGGCMRMLEPECPNISWNVFVTCALFAFIFLQELRLIQMAFCHTIQKEVARDLWWGSSLEVVGSGCLCSYVLVVCAALQKDTRSDVL